MNMQNANVAKEELEKVGNLKNVRKDKENSLWVADFENGVLNFQGPLNIVNGINVVNIYTGSDVRPNDTITVQVSFEL